MRLFLECKPDETLAVIVGVPRSAITHSHGKGRVAKALRMKQGVIGMVDEDPGSAQPINLGKFVELSSNHDLQLKTDVSQNNRLIVICPRLEPWIIKTAKAANLKMEKFNLSDSLSELDSEINHRLANLERLLVELMKLKSARLLHLKSLLLE